MNVERILRLADLIENAPKEQFHMGSWFGEYDDIKITEFKNVSDYWCANNEHWNEMKTNDIVSVVKTNIIDQDIPTMLKCNTTACIAGWAIVSAFNENVDLVANSEFSYNNNPMPVPVGAREYLGLDSTQASMLFYCDDNSIWAKVADQYKFDFDCNDIETWNLNPKHAADVLRRIASGEFKLDHFWGKDINCPTCINERYDEDEDEDYDDGCPLCGRVSCSGYCREL